MRLQKKRTDPAELRFDYLYRPKIRDWQGTPSGRAMDCILGASRARQIEAVEGFMRFSPEFAKLPLHGDASSHEPCWRNGWFESLDAMSLYGFIADRNPRTYVEIGSGNSTKFARRAISDHGLRTRIISIDPHPRAEIDALCDRIIRQPCEDVDQSIFFELGAEDILFVDNSHRSFQGSDVTVFFTEILPGLHKDVLVGIHDIMLPLDYPGEWLARFYNEQYLLAAYLFGGAGGRSIALANAYLAVSGGVDGITLPPELVGMPLFGGAFWMEGTTS